MGERWVMVEIKIRPDGKRFEAGDEAPLEWAGRPYTRRVEDEQQDAPRLDMGGPLPYGVLDNATTASEPKPAKKTRRGKRSSGKYE